MTSYLVLSKKSRTMFNKKIYAYKLYAIDFIDEQPGAIVRIHILSKFCWVGLRTAKFCHPMRQALVETSQCHRLISPNSIGHSDKVMKNAKVANSSVCVRCLPLPNRWYSYLGNIQGTALVGNFSYQAGKPVTVSVRGIVQLENEIWFLIIKKINSWC